MTAYVGCYENVANWLSLKIGTRRTWLQTHAFQSFELHLTGQRHRQLLAVVGSNRAHRTERQKSWQVQSKSPSWNYIPARVLNKSVVSSVRNPGKIACIRRMRLKAIPQETIRKTVLQSGRDGTSQLASRELLDSLSSLRIYRSNSGFKGISRHLRDTCQLGLLIRAYVRMQAARPCSLPSCSVFGMHAFIIGATPYRLAISTPWP